MDASSPTAASSVITITTFGAPAAVIVGASPVAGPLVAAPTSATTSTQAAITLPLVIPLSPFDHGNYTSPSEPLICASYLSAWSADQSQGARVVQLQPTARAAPPGAASSDCGAPPSTTVD